MRPEQITKEVTASGILGHGGAAFPTGRKWGVIKLNDEQPHYLCANADEGEPGTFKDRWILEHAPHLLVESMLITSYALQVRNAFVYIRGEFDLPFRRIQASGIRWGLGSDATAAQVKIAYFQLAKAYHPDTVAVVASPVVKKLSADVFSRIGEAWGVIGDDAAAPSAPRATARCQRRLAPAPKPSRRGAPRRRRQ